MRGQLIQTGCLLAGVLCFLYYIGIILYAGIRTSIAWVWLLGSGFFLFLWRALVWQASHPGSGIRWVTAALLLLAAAGALIILLTGARIAGAMAVRPRAGLEYVIVLGAQVRGTAPSRALRWRLDRAVEYAGENPETVFVLSGGQGPDEGISEAECMYRYMRGKGVEPERLLLEDRSVSTKENLMFSAGQYHLRDKKVGILSNSFHIWRALALAKKEGYSCVFGIPARSDAVMLPHNMLREVCCVLLEKAKGNL